VRQRLARPLLVVFVAAALGGCGGGDGGGGDAEFDPGPAEITKPGTTLALGERAFVRYAGLGPNNEPTIATTLGVTVEEVDEGKASDIEGLGESTVPYYVHAEYENHGQAAIAPSVVSGRFTIVGSDGKEYDAEGVISIGGEFEACPSVESDATLAAEQAVADCAVVTLTEGVSPQEVRFKGDYASTEEPVAWKAQ
jgi:hypothetical protein